MGFIAKPYQIRDLGANSAYAINRNFDVIYTEFNGNIDIDNLKAGNLVRASLWGAIRLDGTNPPAEALTGDYPGLDFSTTATNTIRASFECPHDCDITKPIAVVLSYVMTTAHSGNVELSFSRTVTSLNSSLGTPTSSANTLNPDDSANVYEQDSTFNVPAAALSAKTDIAAIKLERQGASANDTHTGLFRLLDLEIEYTTDGTV